MGELRSWVSRLHPRINAEILDLIDIGETNAAEIERRLIGAEAEKRFPNGEPWPPGRGVPDIRGIRERVKRHSPHDPSGTWSLAKASDEEVRLVMPVLQAAAEKSEGRVTAVTRDQAKWILKVRGAAPDLAPWFVYRLARAYQRRQNEGIENVEDLDALVVLAPWRSRLAMDRFWDQARRRADWFPEVPFRRADGTAVVLPEGISNPRVALNDGTRIALEIWGAGLSAAERAEAAEVSELLKKAGLELRAPPQEEAQDEPQS